MIFEKLNPDSTLKDFLEEAEKEKKELEESYKESRRQTEERKLKEKNIKGGAQVESKLIEQQADKWCKDNGYPLKKRQYYDRIINAPIHTRRNKSTTIGS